MTDSTELHQGVRTVVARNRDEWRDWLRNYHQTETLAWLIIYHKKSKIASIYYDEAVEEALCFGWIDSVPHKRDYESMYLFFARRKPKSNWSKANRDRAEKMIAEGRMTESGQHMIDLARQTGTWEALVEVQNLVIPDDLAAAFHQNPEAERQFQSFPPSSRRGILEWILNAKKAETRQKRIEETVRLASQGIKANHYRQ